MLPLLFEAAARTALIAVGVALILRMMRIRQAALRHRVWTGVLAMMLSLPVWVAWGPRTPLPLLSPEAWQRATLTRTAPEPSRSLAPESAGSGESPAATARLQRWDWGTYALILYFVGMSVLLVRLGIGSFRVTRLLREVRLNNGRLTHAGCAAPITVGWFRPLVILPEGWSRWPDRQLAAILAHEEEHVRRRDPLIQWLALLNRAVFWFHPLAWWLEGELSKLAEEACDSAVLSRGHEPREYAEYLLTLARSISITGTRLNVPGMAALGAGLPERVRNIFAGGQARPISRAKLICLTSVCVAAAVTFAVGSLAHAQPASPAFDVATIKPNRSGEQGGTSRFAGSSYIGTNVALKRVIGLAYSPIQEFVGGPGWIDSERYDITAKAEGNPSREQLQLMMRSLLADRFKLVVRKETRELPAYALAIARNDGKLGPSLRRSTTECSTSDQGKTPGRAQGKAPGGGCFRLGDGSLTGRGATMERLAAELNVVGRLVVDRTGLTGIFDMDVQWTPDEQGTNADLFTALREQLGLELKATRAPVEVIVIDSAQRPSEN